MKIIKEIMLIPPGDNETMWLYVMRDGDFIMMGVQEGSYKKHFKRIDEHPIIINSVQWDYFTTSLSDDNNRLWIFTRESPGASEILIVREISRFKLRDEPYENIEEVPAS